MTTSSVYKKQAPVFFSVFNFFKDHIDMQMAPEHVKQRRVYPAARCRFASARAFLCPGAEIRLVGFQRIRKSGDIHVVRLAAAASPINLIFHPASFPSCIAKYSLGLP